MLWNDDAVLRGALADHHGDADHVAGQPVQVGRAAGAEALSGERVPAAILRMTLSI